MLSVFILYLASSEYIMSSTVWTDHSLICIGSTHRTQDKHYDSALSKEFGRCESSVHPIFDPIFV